MGEWLSDGAATVPEWLRGFDFLDVLCPLLYSQMGRQIIGIQSKKKNGISGAVVLRKNLQLVFPMGMEHLAVSSSLGCRRAPRVLTHGHTTSRNQTLVTENTPVVDDFLL